MKIGGRCLIGLGLFLFGIVEWQISISCIIGGIVAIIFSNEYHI